VIELEELSAVGFGCYRVDARSAQHRGALTRALAAGCNLIDTASNYADGRSEELVGEVLDTTRAPAFVITKAGYVSPSAAAELVRTGLRVSDLPTLEGGTPFSIDPSVLRVVLELSRARLRCRRLDAVLLHNPERLAETGASSDDVRLALEKSFAFLEDEIAAGRLRYYGVSSNALPSADPGDPLDFETLVELSTRSDRSKGLAFAEFPLNLLEREAATERERPSLLARSTSVRTIANRPLNALMGDQLVRLAEADAIAVDDPWDECVELVIAELALRGRPEPWTSFRPMQFLRDNRRDISDPELVDAIWVNQIDPFVAALFGDEPAPAARAAFAALRAQTHSCARAHLAEHTQTAVARLCAEGLLDPQADETLAVAACRYCLDAGADHVLVGMRRPEYVAQLAPLFTATAASA
jgi:aryl-alcohol dehydrogenase-like predicted oxidoreductase